MSIHQARPWCGTFYQQMGMCRDNSPFFPKECCHPLPAPHHHHLYSFRTDTVPWEMENLSKCRRHLSAWHMIHTKYCAKILQEEAGEEK